MNLPTFDPNQSREVREQAAAVAALVVVDDVPAALAAADGDYLAVTSVGALVQLLWAVWQRNDPEGWPFVQELIANDLRRLAAGGCVQLPPIPDAGPRDNNTEDNER